MAKLKENTVVVSPDGLAVPLLKDEDVPEWARDQVGDHLVEGGDDAEPTPYEDQSIKQLKAAIEVRNRDRSEETRIVVDGNTKAAHIAALEADDERIAAIEAASGSGGSGGDATVGGNGGPQQ